MNRNMLNAAVVAFGLGSAVSASANVVLAPNGNKLDFNYVPHHLVSDDQGFSVANNNSLNDATLTFGPSAASAGKVKAADVLNQQLGQSSGGYSSSVLRTLSSGSDVLPNAFAVKNGWRGAAPADVVAVPEPATYALMGLGLVGLIATRRRRTVISIPGYFV